MTPDAATTSFTRAPQAAAPGHQPAPAASASPASSWPPPPAPGTPPTPLQLFHEVARLAFGLMTNLIGVLQPIQSYYLEQARLAMRVCVELCRVMLTIRFAPERITLTQLRQLTRARHVLQALFGYTLPLGPRTSPSVNAPLRQTPSASANHAVPEVPEVPGVPDLSATTSHTPSPTLNGTPLLPDPSHSSHNSHSSHPSPDSQIPHSAFRIPHSSFAPFIPDANTLITAVRSATLPPNCAGALLENPGEALVKALHQLHAVYFSLYPKQSPSPSPSQSSGNLQSSINNLQSPSPSPSQSSGNPSEKAQWAFETSISNPQSDAPSVHPVHSVHDVHNVHLSHSPPT